LIKRNSGLHFYYTPSLFPNLSRVAVFLLHVTLLNFLAVNLYAA